MITLFMVSNCLIFVLYQWFTKGGYVVVRRSHWGWFPHFIWSADLKRFQQFTPISEKRRYRLFPPLVFRGYVHEGDTDLEANDNGKT